MQNEFKKEKQCHAYGKYFGEYAIDADLALLGIGIVVWYIALKIFESFSNVQRQ